MPQKHANYRQKLAMSKLVETRGNVSKAMRLAGYSAVTAQNPQALTRSKGWQELMDKHLADEFLMRKHKALLNKKENIVSYENGKKTVTRTKDIDPYAVGKGLELAYKIKGKFTDSNVTNIGEVKVLINDP